MITTDEHEWVMVWAHCEPFKSPDPEHLKAFWLHFRSETDDCHALINQLSEHFLNKETITASELPCYLMFMELHLVVGEYIRCIELGETLAVVYSNDLRVQDLRARARLLSNDDSELASNIEYAWKPFANHFCSSTFDSLAFFEHDVYLCCVNYLPKSIGSIESTSQSELWNSSTSQSIRKAILDGSYQYCNKMVCPRLRNGDLPLRNEPTLSSYYKDIISNNATSSPGCYPRSIELNEDPSCNLVCPSCRNGPVFRDTNVLKNFEDNILPGIFDYEVNSFLIACYGEPFASAHYLRILHWLDPSKHRAKQLVLFTNGVLFTESKWQELSNLHPYNIEVRISIDAATPESYAKIRPMLRKQGDFGALLKNLEFIGNLRKEERICKLGFFFVVQNDNFSEMSEFVQMAKRHNVDEVVFSEMQKFGVYTTNDALYKMKAVHLKGHPNNEKFNAELNKPIMSDPIVSYHGARL